MTSLQERAPVVVGIDGSRESASALERAIRAARERHLPLHVVHVTERDGPDGHALLDSARFRVSLAGGLPDVVYDLHDGSPAEILRTWKPVPALVVLGALTFGGVRRLLLGSVTWDVARSATVPVLAVRDRAVLWPESQPRVVAAVDGSERSVHVLAFAFEEAAVGRLALRVVHVRTDETRAAAPAELAELVATWSAKFPDVEVELEVLDGDPALQLVHATIDAELIVVSGRPRGRFTPTTLGSVSHAVLLHAHGDVVVYN